MNHSEKNISLKYCYIMFLYAIIFTINFADFEFLLRLMLISVHYAPSRVGYFVNWHATWYVWSRYLHVNHPERKY